MTVLDVINYCENILRECTQQAREAEERMEQHHHRSLDYQKAECDARLARARANDHRQLLFKLKQVRD